MYKAFQILLEINQIPCQILWNFFRNSFRSSLGIISTLFQIFYNPLTNHSSSVPNLKIISKSNQTSLEFHSKSFKSVLEINPISGHPLQFFCKSNKFFAKSQRFYFKSIKFLTRSFKSLLEINQLSCPSFEILV